MRRIAAQRRGAVAIEFALVALVATMVLVGAANLVLELRNWLRVGALADHVGQMIAQAGSITSTQAQTIIMDSLADNSGMNGVNVTVSLAAVPAGGGASTPTPLASSGTCPVSSASYVAGLQPGDKQTFVVVVTCWSPRLWLPGWTGAAPQLNGHAIFASAVTGP